jgi:uncharacterized protein YdcH (DUF465 family)
MSEKRRREPESPASPVSKEELLHAHRALEVRLAELDRHLSLTAAEQTERTRLKKLKLAMKDRIAKL